MSCLLPSVPVELVCLLLFSSSWRSPTGLPRIIYLGYGLMQPIDVAVGVHLILIGDWGDTASGKAPAHNAGCTSIHGHRDKAASDGSCEVENIGCALESAVACLVVAVSSFLHKEVG